MYTMYLLCIDYNQCNRLILLIQYIIFVMSFDICTHLRFTIYFCQFFCVFLSYIVLTHIFTTFNSTHFTSHLISLNSLTFSGVGSLQ